MTRLQRSILKTVALVALTGGVAAYAYVVEYKGGEEKTQREETERRLFGVDRAKVFEVRLRPVPERPAAGAEAAAGEGADAGAPPEGAPSAGAGAAGAGAGDAGTAGEARAPGGITLRKLGAGDSAEDARWRIVEPVEVEADPVEITTLLARFLDGKSRSIAAENVDALAEFGLDPPRGRLDVVTSDGQKAGLLIGDENKFDRTVFVQRVGETRVLLADGALRQLAQKSLFDLRDKRVLPFEVADVLGVAVSWASSPRGLGAPPPAAAPGEPPGEAPPDVDLSLSFAAERTGDESWSLVDPVHDRGDAPTLKALMSDLRFLRMRALVDEHPERLSRWGLDYPMGAVFVRTKGEPPGELRLDLAVRDGSEGPVVYARRSPDGPVVELEPRILETLRRGANAFRDRTILDFDRSRVGEVEIQLRGGEPLRLRKEAGAPPGGEGEETWAVVTPRPGPAKGYKATALVSDLAFVRAKEFVSELPGQLGKYGLQSPERAYIVRDTQGAEIVRLLVGNSVADVTYVTDGTGRRVYAVDKSRVDGLTFRVSDFEKAAVAPKP